MRLERDDKENRIDSIWIFEESEAVKDNEEV